MQRALIVMASLGLAVLLVGAGFLACAFPPTTGLLAAATVDDVTSPFNVSELTSVAVAARDYAFGGHDRAALERVILEANQDLQAEAAASGRTLPPGAPRLEGVDVSDAAAVTAALASASEMYAFSEDTISHLDDCNAIARGAYLMLAVLAATGLGTLVWCLRSGRRRILGQVLIAAGTGVLVCFLVLGIAAAVDFDGFFTLFHGVFFSQGNWQFPYDSLLICSLPTPFWAGMGAIWLGVAALACVACIICGTRLRRNARI